MENMQYQNQEGPISEAMEEVEGENSGNDLGGIDSELNQEPPQVLMNLSAFLKNELTKLQALTINLEVKKQSVERQIQNNKDTLEKLSLVEKQAQEVISESIKVQKENEVIFQQNVEKTVNDDTDEVREPLTMQQIWR